MRLLASLLLAYPRTRPSQEPELFSFGVLYLLQNGSPGESQRNKFADSFALGPVLGKGAYAPVHLAVHKVNSK